MFAGGASAFSTFLIAAIAMLFLWTAVTQEASGANAQQTLAALTQVLR
jgi:hypothetical protein